jgi:DNA (cytosine-5)-methyltransferase 1
MPKRRLTIAEAQPTSVEICSGGGGQALGLEQAGFQHRALVEIDRHSCATLSKNRPGWNVINQDLHEFVRHLRASGDDRYRNVDLLAGGLPCPPFSIAGKQLGSDDDRNLFPAAIELIKIIDPRAVMIENVRGILDAVFADFRGSIKAQLNELGYVVSWRLLNACDFGVSQLRPRVVFVAIKEADADSRFADGFLWPTGEERSAAVSVGARLYDLMKSSGWRGADKWRDGADEIAPTIVGGSLKHGGPDLGPTRARKAWASLGVDGLGIADAPPEKNFVGMPKLTVRMVARLQGFDDDWEFAGGKTAAYRQVGNAFPPPVARAIALRIRETLSRARTPVSKVPEAV